MYAILFYKDKSGSQPVKEYICELAKKSSADKNSRIKLTKIDFHLQVLKQYGTRAGKPYMKHIEGDLWELRPTNDRIFFFYWQDDAFILLHHFQKKTQKTPRNEIEQATRNMADFIERSKK